MFLRGTAWLILTVGKSLENCHEKLEQALEVEIEVHFSSSHIFLFPVLAWHAVFILIIFCMSPKICWSQHNYKLPLTVLLHFFLLLAVRWFGRFQGQLWIHVLPFTVYSFLLGAKVMHSIPSEIVMTRPEDKLAGTLWAEIALQ